LAFAINLPGDLKSPRNLRSSPISRGSVEREAQSPPSSPITGKKSQKGNKLAFKEPLYFCISATYTIGKGIVLGGLPKTLIFFTGILL
jgi:hypothetical protein